MLRILLATTATLVLAGSASAEVLKIGLANPMTGDYAPYGEGNGAACMAEIINEAAAAGDVKVEIMMEDSRSDPQLTLSLAQKYLDAGAVIVHGTPFPDSLIPMAAMAQGFGAIVYSPQITQVEMHEAGLTNFTAGVVPDDVGASALASAVYAKGARNAVLMTSEDAGSWTAGTPVWFGEAFEALGGKVIAKLNHSIGTADWSPQVTEIMAMSPVPDVVHICSIVPDVGILARQLVSAGYEGLVVGCDGFDDPSLEATAGSPDVLSHIMFATHVPVLPDSEAAKFVQTCKDRGYRVNGIFDALGGDMIRILVEAAKDAGTTTDGKAIQAALRARESFDLMTGGSLSFTEKGTWPSRAVPIIGFQDGKRVVVSYDTPSFLPHSK
jgi:branched-chain amino acid transport system substrate-binding protein